MIAIGTFRIVVLGESTAVRRTRRSPAGRRRAPGGELLLLLRAFAAGAVALTGTEAIATGVPAFQPPEAKNAATTLAVMAVLLGILFIGITFLAVNFGITHVELPETQTVISQVARRVYGDGTIPFFLFQAFTALLLVLAANTSFNAFPRLARDPRRSTASCRASSRSAATGSRSAAGSSSSRRSRRRSSSSFGGETHLLIPLYAVGVFIDFTISQAGMVRHWRRERPAGLAAAAGDQRLRLRPDRRSSRSS